MRRLCLVCTAFAAALPACHRSSAGPRAPVIPRGGDAPYELAADDDLAAIRARFEAAVPDSADRASQRRQLADEYARRMDLALADGAQVRAYQSLRRLVSLWTAPELAPGGPASPELGPYRERLLEIKRRTARAGSDTEAATALFALAVIDPANAPAYLGEIEEIFAFADALAVADIGDGAEGARPIEILESVIEVFPSPAAVDRLIALYVGRQGRVAEHFEKRGADFQRVRAHTDVLRTAWHIVRVLARAERIDEAPRVLTAIDGIGDDAELRRRLSAALAKDGDDAAWIFLSAYYRGSDPDLTDLEAALAIAQQGARRFPRSAVARIAAAVSARDLGRDLLAIRLYEEGLAIDPDDASASSQLAELYEFRVASLAASGRPAAAARTLALFERFYARASARFSGGIEPDLANAYAAMGQGLVNLGEIERARDFLKRSLARRPTLEALKSLGVIALKRDRFDDASRYFSRALALPGDDPNLEYERIEIQRLLGQALDGDGERADALRVYREALEAWRRFHEEHELRQPFVAESMVERGKLLWRLGQQDRALQELVAAADVDPSSASVHVDAVSFLLVRGRYREALDIYHRALDKSEIGDYFKVYMSLWIAAEAVRRGEPVDPFAQDLLESRRGRLWYDQLARYASGRARLEELEKKVTTQRRLTELLYYRAVLGDGRASPARARELLERVVASEMLLDFEYDMAKHWLGRSR